MKVDEKLQSWYKTHFQYGQNNVVNWLMEKEWTTLAVT